MFKLLDLYNLHLEFLDLCVFLTACLRQCSNFCVLLEEHPVEFLNSGQSDTAFIYGADVPVVLAKAEGGIEVLRHRS